MENNHEFKTSGVPSPSDVKVILGEPAIIINGVPKPSPEFVRNTAVRQPETETLAESSECFPQGEWLEGRKVLKKFGNKYYKGEITKFDPETNWYMVTYEDGDLEEMEWNDLRHIMLPLDIKSPLTEWLLSLTKARTKKTKKKKEKCKGKVNKAKRKYGESAKPE